MWTFCVALVKVLVVADVMYYVTCDRKHSMEVMACARKAMAKNTRGEFFVDPTTGECHVGTNNWSTGAQGKAYKVESINRDKGCVKWNHYVNVSRVDNYQATQRSFDLLKTALKLGKQFRVSMTTDNQSRYTIVKADVIFMYNDVVCAGLSTIKEQTGVLNLYQCLVCSDGYSQQIESPMFVANPQPARIVRVGQFSEMEWYVKENSCYSLGFEQDKHGNVVTGSRDQMREDFLRHGSSLVLYQELPFNDIPLSTVSQGNTIRTSQNYTYAYIVDQLGMTFDGNRFRYDDQLSKTLMDECLDDGKCSRFECDINGHVMQCLSFAVNASHQWFIDKGWDMVFGRHGTHMTGNGHLTDLVTAIRRGHKVRVHFDAISSEPNVLVVSDDLVTGLFVDEYKLDGHDNPPRQIWRLVSTGSVEQKWRIAYRTWSVTSPLPEVTNVTHHDWFIDQSNWREMYSTTGLPQSNARLVKAVKSGAEIRIKWTYGQYDLFYNLDTVYISADQTVEGTHKGTLPVINIDSSRDPCFSTDDYRIDRQTIRFYSSGRVSQSIWTSANQSMNVIEKQSEDLVWFALDGFGKL